MGSYDVTDRGSFMWPSSDRDCYPVVTKWMDDMYTAINYCRAKNVAVQAGGNAGIWPLALADEFDVVYTFEPDPLNFHCLVNNCDRPNIVKIQAALGNNRGMVGLCVDPHNIGAHYVEGNGIIPVLRIDDLALNSCDFLCLDIEGYEMQAIEGARETIKNYHPVIQLEDKGLSEKYGTKKEEVVQYLETLYDYEVKLRVHRDVILA